MPRAALNPITPRAIAVGASTLALALAGCTSVRVPEPEAAPTDPRCAEIIVSLPTTLLGLSRTETTAQSTAAWGSGETAVVFRCGVTPPPPTTDLCTTIEARNGTQIDWIVHEDTEAGMVLMTTYGREPAVDISVPRAVAPDQPSAAAIELSGLIAPIPQDGRCLAFMDVSGSDAP